MPLSYCLLAVIVPPIIHDFLQSLNGQTSPIHSLNMLGLVDVERHEVERMLDWLLRDTS